MSITSVVKTSQISLHFEKHEYYQIVLYDSVFFHAMMSSEVKDFKESTNKILTLVGTIPLSLPIWLI